ncbi:hypothetical protein, partial [uncultured Desulfovibrio sp.]|uniref:hypothetical protein n=1 Tax=uncultured Desulfovibrio sp. TaxID=167968 RepID=UPI00266F579D
QDPDAKYVTGQPGKVRGSAVPAEAVEHPQREIVEVIKKAGLTPSADALNQLYEAILKIIGVQVHVASKTETGLVQIGDGLNITPEGLLSVLVATLKQNGIMRPDGTTCTVEDGVLKVLQQSNDYMEAWRKSWIGVPRYWRSTQLPSNHCWANGDLIYFNDWPELKEIYEAGGFEGMLMGWDADVETQKANLGKWRPNAAIPTGLYTPALSGQFFRNWALGQTENAGSYNAPGLPNIQGSALLHTVKGASAYGALFFGTFTLNQVHNSGNAWGGVLLGIDASRSSAIYGASSTVMPASIDQPVIIYLGRPR